MKVSLLSKAVMGAIAMIATSQASAISNVDVLYAVNRTNIAVIDTLNLGSVSYINLTGLLANENILGFDIRPSNGQGYVITSLNNLRTIDLSSGAVISTIALTGASFNGKSIGIDFNPQADFGSVTNTTVPSLRVTSNTGDNYAVNVSTGAVGNTVNKINPGFTGVAYTNSAVGVDPRVGATDVTDLYYINSVTDKLSVATTAFNTPTFVEIGSLGVDVVNANGFDILGTTGKAYALLDVDGSFNSNLYSVDLSTGASTYLTTLNGPFNGLSGITTAVPEPESLAFFLAGLGLMAGIATRKSKK